MKHYSVLLLLGSSAYQRVAGITRYAFEHQWYITLDELSKIPRDWSGDGILVTLRSNQPQLREFIQKAIDRGIPIVDYSICHPELRLHRVIGDHVAIGQLAAEHFRERRFQHAVCYATSSSHVVQLRYGGFARTWGDNPPLWIWQREARKSEINNYPMQISWLASRLRSAPKPLAVFAFNDADAVRVLNACQLAELSIPEEVAILGVDDFPLITENQSVPLSSIQHNIERIGYEGAAVLNRLMDGETVGFEPLLVPPSGITERMSTQTLAVSDETLKRALALIDKNLSHSYGIAQLASDLKISQQILRSLFEQHLGTTPIKEFTRLRMARAKLLLANTTLPVKTIAAELGFCNLGYFSNVFTAAVGISPRTYRSRRRA